MKIGFLRLFKDRLKLLKLKKYYSNKYIRSKNSEQYIIYMADGKMLHGGLSDRFCGIVSTFSYCIEHNIKFKIFFNSPYNIEEFFLPNEYDWKIDQELINYNSKDSEPIYIPYIHNINNQRYLANKRLSSGKKQKHVYTNMRYFDEKYFSEYFLKLFKMSDLLKKALDENFNKMPKKYISITFRFQQLLGDFEEGDFPTLIEEEKEILINQCLSSIKNVIKDNPIYEKILVTSDSIKFLEQAKKIPKVEIIPGNIVHVDFVNKSTSVDAHLKSFIDLFMVAKAEIIFIVKYKPLYNSTFCKTASLIYNNKYIEII